MTPPPASSSLHQVSTDSIVVVYSITNGNIVITSIWVSSPIAHEEASDDGDSDDGVPSDDSITDGSEDGSSIPLCPPSEHARCSTSVWWQFVCVCVHSIISVTVSSDGLVHAMVCVYVHVCVRRPGVRSAILQV